MKLVVIAAVLVLVLCAGARAEDWKPAALARIEKLRKGDFNLTVLLPDGRPAAGVVVEVEETRPHFLFGTAVNGWCFRPGARDNPDVQKYRAYVTSHFNAVVSEDDMKWYSVEKERGKLTYGRGDAFLDFARENGLAARGHCLFWSKLKYVQRQPWLVDLSADDLRAAVYKHVDETAARYKGRVICWDVNNEMLDGRWYEDKLGDDVRVEMFKRAKAADPNAMLFVNEYGILGNEAKTDRYIKLIKDLLAAGAPVGGIGIQEHMAERFSPSETRDVPDPAHPERGDQGPLDVAAAIARLDKLAALGLPIHLTEVSFAPTDETRKADALENFYTAALSNPKVEAVLLWGFWEKSHFLGKRAALVDKEWRPTPAGERLERLLTKDFRTTTTATTDAEGRVAFRGFYGTYAVRAKDGAGTASLTPTALTATVKLGAK